MDNHRTDCEKGKHHFCRETYPRRCCKCRAGDPKDRQEFETKQSAERRAKRVEERRKRRGITDANTDGERKAVVTEPNVTKPDIEQ